MVLNEGQDKITKLNETKVSTVSDEKFKAVVIKIHSGLEKKVEELHENFNKEVKEKKKRDEEFNN